MNRPLAEITADVLAANCGHCWARPGVPCDGGGTHLARFDRARRRGLISAGDMAFVLASVIASAVPGAAVPGEALAGAA